MKYTKHYDGLWFSPYWHWHIVLVWPKKPRCHSGWTHNLSRYNRRGRR